MPPPHPQLGVHSLKDIAAGAIIAALSTTFVLWWDPLLWLQGLSHASRLCVTGCIPILGYGIPAAVRRMALPVPEKDLARWRAHASSTTGVSGAKLEAIGGRPLRKLDILIMGITGSVFAYTMWGFSDRMLRFAHEHCEWQHDSRTIVLRTALGAAGVAGLLVCKEVVGHSSRARRTARLLICLCLGMWNTYGTAKVPNPRTPNINPNPNIMEHKPESSQPGCGLCVGAFLPDRARRPLGRHFAFSPCSGRPVTPIPNLEL